MNGICGCFVNDKTSTVLALKQHVKKELPPKHELMESISPDGKAYLALVRRRFGRFVHSPGRKQSLVLYGEIYDDNHNPLSDFALVELAVKLAGDAQTLAGLNGCFSGALYDASSRSLFLFSDPFGNLPLFYRDDKAGFFFSTHSQILRQHPQPDDWDKNGLLQHLSLGFAPDGKTLYRHVQRLPAASVLRFDAGGICITEYRAYTKASQSRSFKDLYPEIRDDLVRSVKGKVSAAQKTASALTGGFDSRVTWAILKYAGLDKQALAHTHGLPQSRDMTIASKITKRLQLNHFTIPFGEAFIKNLPQLWQEAVTLGEGLFPVTSAHAIQTWRSVSSEADMILDSHGGALYRRQVMKGAARFVDINAPLAAQVLPRFSTGLEKWAGTRKEIARKMIETTTPGLERFFREKLATTNLGGAIDAFYRDQISVHKYSAGAAVQTRFIHFEHPFLSDAAVMALNSLADADKRRQRVYRALVDEMCPQLKNFALENMGLPAPYRGFTVLRYLPMAWERAIAKLPGVVQKRLSLRRFVSDYDFFFAVHREFVREILLQPHTMFFDLFDRAVLEQELDDGLLSSALTGHLLTFKMFLHRFHPMV